MFCRYLCIRKYCTAPGKEICSVNLDREITFLMLLPHCAYCVCYCCVGYCYCAVIMPCTTGHNWTDLHLTNFCHAFFFICFFTQFFFLHFLFNVFLYLYFYWYFFNSFWSVHQSSPPHSLVFSLQSGFSIILAHC